MEDAVDWLDRLKLTPKRPSGDKPLKQVWLHGGRSLIPQSSDPSKKPRKWLYNNQEPQKESDLKDLHPNRKNVAPEKG